MKDELCRAFCEHLSVRKVPAGLAVGTPFDGINGEPIGFYIVPQPGQAHSFRLEDDGITVPLLEAAGVDMLPGTTRGNAFAELLDENGVIYDEDATLLHTEYAPATLIPSLALRFVSVLLRLQDFLLLTPERVASTFKEDATRQIAEAIGDRAVIAQDEPVSPDLSDITADLVIRANDRPTVAVFFGVSEHRVTEAVLLQTLATYQVRFPCSVIALLETEAAISRKSRQRANNRLTAVPIFLGDEKAAVTRIEREALGTTYGVVGHA